jgi:thymidylate synthase ThyX
MLEQVREEPAMPIHWGKNQSGMQAREELEGGDLSVAGYLWSKAAMAAAEIAEEMAELGLHKQVANRILEPFQHIHVIVTATEWSNFLALRAHPDAQPEIHELAVQIRDAMAGSTPTKLLFGQWHLPYIRPEERTKRDVTNLLKSSAARCARVSYLRHDGLRPRIDEDLDLYERLMGSQPIHASPVEHQATPDILLSTEHGQQFWKAPRLHGNFTGWIQHRKLVETRSVADGHS